MRTSTLTMLNASVDPLAEDARNFFFVYAPIFSLPGYYLQEGNTIIIMGGISYAVTS